MPPDPILAVSNVSLSEILHFLFIIRNDEESSCNSGSKWLDFVKVCLYYVKRFWALHLKKYKYNQFIALYCEIYALELIILYAAITH
jgi:hypothetical protein